MTSSTVQVFQIDSSCDLLSEVGSMLWRLCCEADQDPNQFSGNLETRNWSSRSETLLYCIYIEKRFDPPGGVLFATVENNEISSIGGIYRSDFCPEHIAIGASRTYTRPSMRDRYWQGDYILPAQVNWAKKNNIREVIFTVNHDNTRVIRFLEKLSLKNKLQNGPSDLGKIYEKLEQHPKPVIIKNTTQLIFKLKLDDLFVWDYSNIEVK